MRAAALTAALLLAASPAVAQTRIAESWEAAVEEATARNVPILIGLSKEKNCPYATLFKSGDVAGLLNDRVLVLIGHRPGEHEPVEQVDPKTREKRLVCPLFPQITCEVHETIYNDRAGYFDYDTLPAAFLLSPSGDVMIKGMERVGVKQLVAKLEEAQKQLGVGVFGSEIARLERKLEKGDKKADKGHLKGALRVYENELEDCEKEFLEKKIEARLAALDERALAMIEEAKQEDDAKTRRDTLLRIAREMKGRAPAEAAEAALEEAE